MKRKTGTDGTRGNLKISAIYEMGLGTEKMDRAAGQEKGAKTKKSRRRPPGRSRLGGEREKLGTRRERQGIRREHGGRGEESKRPVESRPLEEKKKRRQWIGCGNYRS